MSEEQAAEAVPEGQAETQPETQDPKSEAAPEGKAANGKAEGEEGREFVEFPDKETEKRFKRVYGHMKQNERVVEQLAKDNKALMARLDEQEKKQSAKATDDTMARLKAEKAQALEAGEYAKVVDLDERMLDLKAKPKETPKAVPKPEPEAEEGLTAGEQKRILQWTQESDADGRPVRPWAQEDSPEYSKTLRTIRIVDSDPEFQDLEAILEEVDRIMAPKPKTQRSAAPVLSADPTAGPKKGKKIALSEAQKQVAAKMGLSEEAYLKAMQKYARP